MSDFTFILPGKLDQITGGYLFDRTVVEGARQLGRAVTVVELPGDFQEPDETAREAARFCLANLPDRSLAVIDGLALLAFSDCWEKESKRLSLVVFVHHTLADETGLTPAEQRRVASIESRLLRGAQGLLCPSANTAQAVAAYGVDARRIEITPPGTPKPGRFLRRRSPLRPVELLCVASLIPRKGHRLLVEALDSLADRDWHCHCIGSLTRDPDTSAAISYEIGRRGLKGRISLAGEWQPERLPEAYRASDIFVLPSYHEGYGMAFAEALAHGLPIVATSGGAIPQTVPKKAGLLVPPGDVLALTSALAKLLDDPKMRAKLSAGARAEGAKLLDWPSAVRGWMQSLDRLKQDRFGLSQPEI